MGLFFTVVAHEHHRVLFKTRTSINNKKKTLCSSPTTYFRHTYIHIKLYIELNTRKENQIEPDSQTVNQPTITVNISQKHTHASFTEFRQMKLPTEAVENENIKKMKTKLNWTHMKNTNTPWKSVNPSLCTINNNNNEIRIIKQRTKFSVL